MILTLKIFSILFILNNIFYILNYRRLDKPFSQRDKNSILDLFFYFNKLLFVIWIIIGLISPMWIYFLIISSLILLRIPIHYLNKNLSTTLFRLTPIINIVVMLIFIIKG